MADENHADGRAVDGMKFFGHGSAIGEFVVTGLCRGRIGHNLGAIITVSRSKLKTQGDSERW